MFLLDILTFILGAVIGSFLNVVILRYLSGETFVKGRSKCMSCHKELRWWELIPVVSYLILRGRCARCKKKISIQYPLVELAMGVVAVLIVTKIPAFAGMTWGSTAMTATTTAASTWIPAFAGMTITATWVLLFNVIVLMAIASLLIILFVIDLKTLLLPDIFVFILFVAVAIKLLVTKMVSLDSIYGVLVGAGFLLFLWIITRGRGIGMGDIKLMVPLGAFFGFWGSITLLFLAFVFGGVISIALLMRQKAKLNSQIPFGPFLAGSALILLLFPVIIDWFSVALGLSTLF